MILDILRSSEETLVGFCFGAVFCGVAENLTSVTVLSHLRQQVIESGSTYCVKLEANLAYHASFAVLFRVTLLLFRNCGRCLKNIGFNDFFCFIEK